MLFPLQVSKMSDTGVGREYAYRHTTVGPGVRGWVVCLRVGSVSGDVSGGTYRRVLERSGSEWKLVAVAVVVDLVAVIGLVIAAGRVGSGARRSVIIS